ncbi:VanW family protein [Deinococcus sp. SL84]|uniref:VanW family protein n=1 Tax=Deinococcus sp. SL84 TaxID=2994663 RepID=UPI0022725624|nr:VanW family protein [Deinococcus sp. SL84]MCY1702710.1 VanW family protein [Deinococcus sp. SL84]
MPVNAAPESRSSSPRRPGPWLWGTAALTALLGSALALSLGQSGSGLAPGVRIGGVDVGGLSQEEAQARLSRDLPAAPQMTVRAGGKSWQLSAAELGWQRDTAAALEQAQAYTASRGWTQRLQGLTGQGQPADFSVPVRVDEAQAAARLARLTAPLGVTPQDGEIKFDEKAYRYVVKGGREGKQANAKAAAQQFAAHPEATELNVAFQAVTSAYSPARLKVQADKGNALIRPLTVRLQDSDTAVTLTARQVANLYWATRDGIKPDPDAIEATFKGLLAQVDRPATPARYVASGKDWVAREGRSGHEVQREEARQVFEQNVLDPAATESVWPAQRTEPSFTVADLPDPAGLELVASGESTYEGSSEARRENVRVAAQKLDGYVVPAGENFSFLQAIGGITAEDGFVSGLIISGGQTVDGLGGGVCQVSTTAFRSLYNAGLPVVERNQHSYRVPYYEPQTGFEAAVYDPGLDLVMKNDTGAPLVVRTVNDNARSRLTVELWGKKPERQVTVSDAVITAQLPAPAPRYVVNSSLAPGQQRFVEGSRPGLYLYINRTIKDAKGTRTERLDTRYEPWPGTIERGPAQ